MTDNTRDAAIAELAKSHHRVNCKLRAVAFTACRFKAPHLRSAGAQFDALPAEYQANLTGTVLALEYIKTLASNSLTLRDAVERAERLLAREHKHDWRPDLVQCAVEQDALGILRTALASVR